ncbi:MAG TPA: hypothetical protein VGD39_20615 [Nocardioides sp.]|jgi:hypothetical protein
MTVASKIRARLAQLVWLVAALCALLLAVGALLIALDANKSNDLVDFVLRAADYVDLGVFSRQDGIKEFRGQGAEVKNALFNWGLGAVAWLVVGRILDRIIKP